RDDASSAVVERAVIAQPAVRRYSDEIVEQIHLALAEYAWKSQELDRTFPTRLIKQDASAILSLDELEARLTALDEERSRLMALGLLASDGRNEQIQPTEAKSDVLSIYVDDVEKKLGIFDALARRIDLFLE